MNPVSVKASSSVLSCSQIRGTYSCWSNNKKGSKLVFSHLMYTSFGCSKNNSVIMILQHSSCQVSCTRPTAKPLTDTLNFTSLLASLQHSIMILGQSLGFNHKTGAEQTQSCSKNSMQQFTQEWFLKTIYTNLSCLFHDARPLTNNVSTSKM